MEGNVASGAGEESAKNGGKEILGSGGNESLGKGQGSGGNDGSGGKGANNINLRAASPASMDENVRARTRDKMKKFLLVAILN